MANWRATLRTTVIVAPTLLLGPSCAGVSQLFSSDKADAGFVEVDDLLGRVERVHVDCELAGQNVAEAMAGLLAMAGPQFRGDPTLAFEDLMAAIELSDRQEELLREDYAPMQESAVAVFERWNADLEAFTSEVMREHSASRMAAARGRYAAIVAAVDPALAAYSAFNAALRDHALYLGNDFNAESLALIEGELRRLISESSELTAAFDECTRACEDYVRKSALRGQVSPRARRDV